MYPPTLEEWRSTALGRRATVVAGSPIRMCHVAGLSPYLMRKLRFQGGCNVRRWSD